ncbi:MAG: 3-deoxy-7-phosphoheptulonate synthase [Actinobacteria bacterium]|nr:3-deoxy-7-phosphoheptulonate synthase [Actinomycetota bacterium]
MIVVMKPKASKKQIAAVVARIQELGYQTHENQGTTKTVIGAIGDKDKECLNALIAYEGVEKLVPIRKPYKLAARSSKEEDTIINIGPVQVGGGTFVVMAGPCSVESESQILSSAEAVKTAGGHFLRGGAYKPRTSPYSFQGLEEEGLELLSKAKRETGLGIITELLSVRNIESVVKHADIIQIGARNMQNFSLLKELNVNRPILLKRGLSSTLEELLMSAEYIMSVGNYQVMLCERGIRTFETAYRNTLDLNAVPALKSMTHLPVIVDPSHGTGRIDLIPTMAKAAIAAGADGIMIEIHPDPPKAYSDGPQSLNIPQFNELMEEIKPFVSAAGKRLLVAV